MWRLHVRDAGDEGSYTTYQTTALNGTAATASKTLSFSPAEYYLANGSKTKLIGWYPRRSGVTFTQGTKVVILVLLTVRRI